MVTIVTGDCLDILPTLDAASVDACVTDPPYGLSFMGKAWDHGVPGEPYWREVGRVLKTGGHLLAFGGTRTHHRLMVAIEDAGFEIRDTLMWLHGQGFPKGKGQLKPAWEPIILARKPLTGTVAQNVLAHGTGGLNIDATRIGYASDADLAFTQRTSPPGAPVFTNSKYGANRPEGIVNPTGRWPANCVLSHEPECQEVGTKRVKASRLDQTIRRSKSGSQSIGKQTDGHCSGYADADGTETVTAWECVEGCPVRLLDEQSGERRSAGLYPVSDGWSGQNAVYSQGVGKNQGQLYADSGGASRFFYTAKASRAERGAYNDHATVKPLALMQWLVRLVTPSGGVVLDPFLGSGTTALACQREGFDCIGIERDEHSVEIARRRLSEDAGMFADVTVSG